jgi:hypothetical protein
MVAMVADPEVALDEGSNPLGGPEFRPIAVGHCPLGQQPDEAGFLACGESRRTARRGLGLQRGLATRLPGIPPPKHATRVAAQTAGDLMQGQVLVEERDDPLPPRLEHFGRPARAHGVPSGQEGSMILHYLCGCQ